MAAAGKVMVVSGPSGVGKSTILRALRQRLDVDFSISATTRPPRPGEVDGQDYRFVTPRQFDELIAADELLEWAEVFGQRYGTPAEPVRKAVAAGRIVVLDIDVQGALQVHRKMPEAVFVLIAPPSRQVLAQRLAARASESAEAQRARLAKATEELDAANRSGVYNYRVVNDDLASAVEAMIAIFQKEQPGA